MCYKTSLMLQQIVTSFRYTLIEYHARMTLYKKKSIIFAEAANILTS